MYRLTALDDAGRRTPEGRRLEMGTTRETRSLERKSQEDGSPEGRNSGPPATPKWERHARRGRRKVDENRNVTEISIHEPHGIECIERSTN